MPNTNQTQQRAAACSIHPTRLTFTTCPDCGVVLCHECMGQTGRCSSCSQISPPVKSVYLSPRLVSALAIVALFAIFFVQYLVTPPLPVRQFQPELAPAKPDPQPVVIISSPPLPAPIEPLKILGHVSNTNLNTWFQPGPWRFSNGLESPIEIVNQNGIPLPVQRERTTRIRGEAQGRLTSFPQKPALAKKATPTIQPKPGLPMHLTGNNRFMKYHLEHVPTREKWITLSFDGDHLNNCTIPILDILDDAGIKANIFLTGKFIEMFPESVLDIVSRGHEIGNHTWNHPHLTQYDQTRTHRTRERITRTYFLAQLKRTADLYRATTGEDFSPWWRAPYGEHNLELRTWAYSEGYLHIGWTRGYDSMDWMSDPKGKYYLSPGKLKRKLIRHLKKPGHKIVLMHLGSKRPEGERPYTILESFIAESRQKGYRFTTVSDLLNQTKGFQMAALPPREHSGELLSSAP